MRKEKEFDIWLKYLHHSPLKCPLWQMDFSNKNVIYGRSREFPGSSFLINWGGMSPPPRKLALLPSHDDSEPRGVYLSSFRTPWLVPMMLISSSQPDKSSEELLSMCGCNFQDLIRNEPNGTCGRFILQSSFCLSCRSLQIFICLSVCKNICNHFSLFYFLFLFVNIYLICLLL